MMHRILFVYDWQNSRQAHTRIIQIVEVNGNMQKVYDEIKEKIKNGEITKEMLD